MHAGGLSFHRLWNDVGRREARRDAALTRGNAPQPLVRASLVADADLPPGRVGADARRENRLRVITRGPEAEAALAPRRDRMSERAVREALAHGKKENLRRRQGLIELKL